MKSHNTSPHVAGLKLTREALARTRKKALRQGCWHKALNKLERGIVDLTIRLVEEVKSAKLGAALATILAKLANTFRPGYLSAAETLGRPLASRISRLAQSWGNTQAAEWREDTALIRYLGVNALNPEISSHGELCT